MELSTDGSIFYYMQSKCFNNQEVKNNLTGNFLHMLKIDCKIYLSFSNCFQKRISPGLPFSNEIGKTVSLSLEDWLTS